MQLGRIEKSFEVIMSETHDIDSLSNFKRHSSNPFEQLGTTGDPVTSGEEFSYQHVPFEPAGTRRVRYLTIEVLQPRQISFDEDF